MAEAGSSPAAGDLQAGWAAGELLTKQAALERVVGAVARVVAVVAVVVAVAVAASRGVTAGSTALDLRVQPEVNDSPAQ